MKPLQISTDVVPASELEQQARPLLRRLSGDRRPIVITQDGRPAAVLITPGDYDRFCETERFIAAVHEGLGDADAGRVLDDDRLGAELDAEFGPLRP